MITMAFYLNQSDSLVITDDIEWCKLSAQIKFELQPVARE